MVRLSVRCLTSTLVVAFLTGVPMPGFAHPASLECGTDATTRLKLKAVIMGQARTLSKLYVMFVYVCHDMYVNARYYSRVLWLARRCSQPVQAAAPGNVVLNTTKAAGLITSFAVSAPQGVFFAVRVSGAQPGGAHRATPASPHSP